MTWAHAVAPLRNRNFAWYFASRFVNTLGTMMASVALAFAVLDITDSAIALGQVLAARTIPMIALLLYGGVIADRLPRTLVLQVSNAGSALSQGAIAVLVLSGEAEIWMLVVLSIVQGAVSGVAFPAMASVLPQLVPKEQLQPANALVSLTRNGMMVLGPTVGALLVVTVGSGWALMVDASTWLLSAILLLPVTLPPKEASAEPADTVRELREGWTFFWATPWLWRVVVGFGALNLIHAGAWFTLGPAIADDTIGRQGWGLVLSAEAAGLLITTVVLLRVRLERPLLLGMIGVALMAPPMLLLGVSPHLVGLVVAAFVAGAGTEVFGMGWNLAMQENIDDSMLSRAYSYDALGSFVAIPVGQLAFGPLAAAFGYEEVLVVASVVYVAIVALVLCSRSVRTLQRAPATPTDPVTSATP
jgi:predicted MFS family arabinose efflux permease